MNEPLLRLSKAAGIQADTGATNAAVNVIDNARNKEQVFEVLRVSVRSLIYLSFDAMSCVVTT